ncbi:hypothetical protein P4639_28495 [Priestia megaterium]|uniref:fascin domain-containing protein n=1 Tax=Priestia megaterium TaxID=1404 RepID=UPI002E23615E|nr:hypothetical protein [Priestia megaterium]
MQNEHFKFYRPFNFKNECEIFDHTEYIDKRQPYNYYQYSRFGPYYSHYYPCLTPHFSYYPYYYSQDRIEEYRAPIVLKAKNNKYVVISNDDALWAIGMDINEDRAQFNLMRHPDGKVGLQGFNQKFINVREDGRVVATVTNPAEWKSKFDLIQNNDGTIALRSTNGNYISAELGSMGELKTPQGDHIRDYEKFMILNSPAPPQHVICMANGGKGGYLDSGNAGVGIISVDYTIHECQIALNPKIAGIKTGGNYVLSRERNRLTTTWPGITGSGLDRYLFTAWVENKTLWVEYEYQRRSYSGIPPHSSWVKVGGVKTKLGSWANLKF